MVRWQTVPTLPLLLVVISLLLLSAPTGGSGGVSCTRRETDTLCVIPLLVLVAKWRCVHALVQIKFYCYSCCFGGTVEPDGSIAFTAAAA